jgi:hypothetical protein
MNIGMIAGFAVISECPETSHKLYEEALGLNMKHMGEYHCMDRFPGCNHFGIWPLAMAARSCFGTDIWPVDIAVPSATMEFELDSADEVQAAVEELKARGYIFVHDVIEEPWGQTMARFISPENILIGLSYAPWLHE